MIGIFDSGLGGLFLLKELSQKLPQQSFIYLADRAHFPYGEKKLSFVQSLVKKNITFLKNQGAKRIIVACNTASAVLEEQSTYPVSVTGVIEPALKQADKVSITRKIGVLATTGTTRSQIFLRKTEELKLNLQIHQQACPRLAPFLEEGGWKIVQTQCGSALLKNYLKPLLDKNVDTIIMGCTHYLCLKPIIEKYIGVGKKAVGPVNFLIQDLLSQEKNIKMSSIHQAGSQKEPCPRNVFSEIHLFVTRESEEFEQQVRMICENQFTVNIKKN